MGSFSADGGWYAYTESSGGVGILHLNNGESQKFKEAKSYEFLSETKILLTLSSSNGNDNPRTESILLFDLTDGDKKSIDGVLSHQTSPSSQEIAYVVARDGHQYVEIVNAESFSVTAVASERGGSRFSSLVWGKNDKAIAFSEESGRDQSQAILLYIRSDNASRVQRMDIGEIAEFSSGFRLAADSLVVSDDLKFVLFEMEMVKQDDAHAHAKSQSVSSVEIWNARNTILPASSKYPAPVERRMLAWRLAEGKLVALTKARQTVVSLAGNQRFVVAFSKNKALLADGYELDYRGMSADVYIVNVASGEQKKILDRQDVARRLNLSVSPDGRYIAYIQKGKWWAYDVDRDEHIAVSGSTGYSLIEPWPESGPRNNSWDNVPYGSPGWMADSGNLVFYDEFDIWVSSPDGLNLRRVTKGREDGIVYRVYSPFADVGRGSIGPMSTRYEGVVRRDSGGRVVLSTFDTRTKKSGFSVWAEKSGVSKVVLEDAHVDFIEQMPSSTEYLYRRQRFDLPPELVLTDNTGSYSKVVVRSNTQHQRFNWGRVELIEYPAPDGKRMQGLLYYPANFRAGKKYPMVVNVYEDISDKLHRYIAPSDTGQDGMNHYPANLTIQGYFVLMPDIVYKANDPGISAAKSVIAAVEHVLQSGMIQSDGVGLMGHSFGAYETAFIITQTNLFSAAVSGNGVTDLVGNYMEMEDETPNLYSFEAQQYRMPTPFHVDPTPYLRNSPIYNASKISTPLLTYVGLQDPKVNPPHSFAMFNLLRRMKKDHVLLVYPDEGHVIQNKNNGADLYSKIMAWFDHYLKKRPAERWMLDDMEDAALTGQ